MPVPDEGLEEPRRLIEDACRPILESRHSQEGTSAPLQDREYESLVKDTAKSASDPSTVSEAFALLRYLVQVPNTTSDDDPIAAETKALVATALKEVIATTEARSVSDVHARVTFIEEAAATGTARSLIAACAGSLRRDIYALCRGLLGESEGQGA